MTKKTTRTIKTTLPALAALIKPDLDTLQHQITVQQGTIRALNAAVAQLEMAKNGQGALNTSLRRTLNELEQKVFEASCADGPTWKTKDGTLIRMRAMTDSHLANTIAFLEKQATKLSGEMFTKLHQLNDEKKRRETIRANEKKWGDLHNGTGAYAIVEGTPSPDKTDQEKEIYRLELALNNWQNCAEYRLKEIQDQRKEIERLRAKEGSTEQADRLRRARDIWMKQAEDWKALAQQRLEANEKLNANLHTERERGQRILHGRDELLKAFRAQLEALQNTPMVQDAQRMQQLVGEVQQRDSELKAAHAREVAWMNRYTEAADRVEELKLLRSGRSKGGTLKKGCE